MRYKAGIAALAVGAAFGALAQERNMGQMEMRVALALQDRTESCQPALDGSSSRGELMNGRMAALSVVVPVAQTYPIVSNGLTACFNTNLRGLTLTDGRPVLAVLNLGEKSISLNPKPDNPRELIALAGKGLNEALNQIRLRGGPQPPAHMLQPLAVVRDADSQDGFTIVPNDSNVFRALEKSVLRPVAGR